MTLADQIEKVLGEERFRKIKEYKFSDTARKILGEERYSNIERSLYQYLVEKDHSMPLLDKPPRMAYHALKKFDEWLPLERILGERVSPKLRHAMHKVLVDTEYSKIPDKVAKGIHYVLKEMGKETYYGFFVDAAAQNLISLVYIFNDKYLAGRSWKGAWGTRANAAVGNTITGRPYGAWQDFVIAKLDEKFNINNDPNKYRRFFKDWGAKSSAFASGQSWLYFLFLTGGSLLAGDEVDFKKIAQGVATLTVLAPLLGPYSDKIYQEIRHQFGLPRVPEYSAKSKTTIKDI